MSPCRGKNFARGCPYFPSAAHGCSRFWFPGQPRDSAMHSCARCCNALVCRCFRTCVPGSHSCACDRCLDRRGACLPRLLCDPAGRRSDWAMGQVNGTGVRLSLVGSGKGWRDAVWLRCDPTLAGLGATIRQGDRMGDGMRRVLVLLASRHWKLGFGRRDGPERLRWQVLAVVCLCARCLVEGRRVSMCRLTGRATVVVVV